MIARMLFAQMKSIPSPDSGWLEYGFAGCMAFILVATLVFLAVWVPKLIRNNQAFLEKQQQLLIDQQKQLMVKYEASLEREREHFREVLSIIAKEFADNVKALREKVEQHD